MNIKTVNRNGLKFSYVNKEEFEMIYKDIFVQRAYDFRPPNSSPYILDCGSHIGVSVLFFKQQFPHSRIVAFEPNPNNFKLLELNISQNDIHNVSLVNAALFNKKGTTTFYISSEEENPWSWGDSATLNKYVTEESRISIEVRSLVLSEYLDRDVDLLKLDIEGSEGMVFEELDNKIGRVKEIHLEFHGDSANPNNKREKILSSLRANNFLYTINQNGNPVTETSIAKTDAYYLIIHAKQTRTLLYKSTIKLNLRHNYQKLLRAFIKVISKK